MLNELYRRSPISEPAVGDFGFRQKSSDDAKSEPTPVGMLQCALRAGRFSPPTATDWRESFRHFDEHLVDLAHAGGDIERDRKEADTAPIAIFDPAPTPNHMMMTGKKMIFGVGPR